MKHVIMFYGKECPYSQAIMPVVDSLMEEGSANIEKREVWHDEDNAKYREKYADLLSLTCSSQTKVPAFVIPDEKRAICNPTSFLELTKWILTEKDEEGQAI